MRFKSATGQFASDENAELSSPAVTANEELCDEDMDSSGTISDVPTEQLYDEAMEWLSEGNSQCNENWILLPPSAATSEEAQDEHLDTSSAVFSDTLTEQTHDESMVLLYFLIRDIDLQGDTKFPLTPPATPIEEPRDEDQDSVGTLFSDASIEQPYDEGMGLLDRLELEFDLQDDEKFPLTPPATPIEEPGDEDQDSVGTLFSDASTEQSHEEGMESMDSLISLFSGINLQHDEGSGITALSPPPNRRIGPPDEGRTTLDEPSLTHVDTGRRTEPQNRPLLLCRIIEMVAPESVGRKLQVHILYVEMDETTNVDHHPTSMEIHLISDVDTRCNILLQGPGKNNTNSEDLVVIYSKYQDQVINNNGSRLLQFIFFTDPLRITYKGNYLLKYIVRDFKGHILQTSLLEGKGYATHRCPKFTPLLIVFLAKLEDKGLICIRQNKGYIVLTFLTQTKDSRY